MRDSIEGFDGPAPRGVGLSCFHALKAGDNFREFFPETRLFHAPPDLSPQLNDSLNTLP
jgi:hypothetical protein